jgi:hypothetical protein
MFRTQDLHVKEIVRLLTPRELKAQLPTTDAANATVARSRERGIRTVFWALTRTASRASSARRAIRTRTSCCAAIARGRITTRKASARRRKN